jgi:hypothetical protein
MSVVIERDMLIAETLESLQREGVVDALGFLQAQHVRPRRFEEFGDDVDAQAHRVDIPRCQGKTHQGRVLPRFVSVAVLVHSGLRLRLLSSPGGGGSVRM